MSYTNYIKIVAGENPAKEINEWNKKYSKHWNCDSFFEMKEIRPGETLFTANSVCDWDNRGKAVSSLMRIIRKYAARTSDSANGIDFMRHGEDLEDTERYGNLLTTAFLGLEIRCYRNTKDFVKKTS